MGEFVVSLRCFRKNGINMFQMHKTKHVGLGSVCCTQLHLVLVGFLSFFWVVWHRRSFGFSKIKS